MPDSSVPRQLPCAHSFCEKCLQSHITAEVAKHEKLRYVKCPVCRNSASPSIKDRPTSEWATLFPVSTVLQSMLTAISKVDRFCDAFNTEGTAAPAVGFCVVCKEAMCGDCLKVHRKQKMTKDHTILCVEELVCNPNNIMKLAEGFTCSEHHGEDIKYCCKDHNVPCCAICFLNGHKICSKVIDLKEELPTLLCENKPVEIIADMKKIEAYLKTFMEMNEFSVNNLAKQVNGLTAEIRKIRKEINDLTDELEKNVPTELGKVATTTSFNTLPLACLCRPMKDCRVERVDVIDLKVPTGITSNYTGVTFLPGDRLMLADHFNSQFILLSSSYQFITSHTLTGKPWNICVLDDQEVAVSLYNEIKIQILSVIGDVIRPVKMMTTKYICIGIAAAGNGEMVVIGHFGKNKNYWSLITTRGDVKCTHQYHYPYYDYYNYVAVNNKKTRVYVSVFNSDSLLCSDMDGRKQFTYSPDNLIGFRGVAVDNYDNIYVLGNSPDNIHQLSPDGSVIHVVNAGVPKFQWAICIHKSKDILLVTNASDERRKLHIYQLK